VTANNDVGLFRRMMVGLLSGARLNLNPGDGQFISYGVAGLQENV
jgi:hypothetical protein